MFLKMALWTFWLVDVYLTWTPSCSSQAASFYLLCRTGPSYRHQHFFFLLFLLFLLFFFYLRWHKTMPAVPFLLFWLTCYDCPVPLLVHQDNLSRQQFPALSLCSRAPLDKALLVSTYLFSFYDYYPSRLTAILGLHPLCTIYILFCGLLGLYHSRIVLLCFYFFAFLLGLLFF